MLSKIIYVGFLLTFLPACKNGVDKEVIFKEAIFGDTLAKSIQLTFNREKRISASHKFFEYSISEDDFLKLRKHLESSGYDKFRESPNGVDLHHLHPNIASMNQFVIYSFYKKNSRASYSFVYFPKDGKFIVEYFNEGR